MEQPFEDKILNNKFKELTQAIDTFAKSMSLNLEKFQDEIEVDTLKNGQIQKFEYTIELTWKFIKSYLKKVKGINAEGPKDVIRQFAKFNHFTPEEITQLLAMIDSRNKIAHEYKEYIMSVIYPKLSDYQVLISKILLIKLAN